MVLEKKIKVDVEVALNDIIEGLDINTDDNLKIYKLNILEKSTLINKNKLTSKIQIHFLHYI